MADLKISQLSDGGNAQAADEFVVARSGANYRIDGASVAAAATSVGTLTSLTVSGDLTVDTSTLKVDSTNNRVGIGTTSPNNVLDVFDASNPRIGLSGPSTASAYYLFRNSTSASNVGYIGYEFASNAMPFATNGSEKMRLDASGNLGLGVTPSAWSTSYYKAIEGGDSGNQGAVGFRTDVNGVELFANAYFNGTNNIYKFTGAAGLYQNTGGTHAWLVAPSGTAGDPITFTQAMTLDASGNLLVGTTSDAGIKKFSASATGLAVAGPVPAIAVVDTSDATNFVTYLANTSGAAYLVNVHSTSPLIFGTNDTERARITSGGLFQVLADGANSTFTDGGQIALKRSGNNPYISWHESTGARIGYMLMNASAPSYISVGANQPLVFETNNTERARITSGGYFKASNTGTYNNATGTFSEISNNGAGSNAVWLTHTSASDPYGPYINFSAAAPDNNTNYFIACVDNVATRMIVYSDGDILNHDGTYGTLPSERRFKQDITDANTQWDDIKNIRLRRYRMISDVETKGEEAPYHLGVIIDELEQVSPGLVIESPVMEKREVTDEDGNVTTEQVQVDTVKGWKTSIVHLKALKALQEAMARIEALEARLEALEA